MADSVAAAVPVRCAIRHVGDHPQCRPSWHRAARARGCARRAVAGALAGLLCGPDQPASLCAQVREELGCSLTQMAQHLVEEKASFDTPSAHTLGRWEAGLRRVPMEVRARRAGARPLSSRDVASPTVTTHPSTRACRCTRGWRECARESSASERTSHRPGRPTAARSTYARSTRSRRATPPTPCPIVPSQREPRRRRAWSGPSTKRACQRVPRPRRPDRGRVGRMSGCGRRGLRIARASRSTRTSPRSTRRSATSRRCPVRLHARLPGLPTVAHRHRRSATTRRSRSASSTCCSTTTRRAHPSRSATCHSSPSSPPRVSPPLEPSTCLPSPRARHVSQLALDSLAMCVAWEHRDTPTLEHMLRADTARVRAARARPTWHRSRRAHVSQSAGAHSIVWQQRLRAARARRRVGDGETEALYAGLIEHGKVSATPRADPCVRGPRA